MEMETPNSRRIKMRSTAALYEAFAACTLASSATLKPDKPSGMSSERNGLGCLSFGRPGTGRSLARDAVPQLGASCACTNLCLSDRTSLSNVANCSVSHKSYLATTAFSARLTSLSTESACNPRPRHALLSRQVPAKISRTKPVPLLHKSSPLNWWLEVCVWWLGTVWLLSMQEKLILTCCADGRTTVPGLTSAASGLVVSWCSQVGQSAAPCPDLTHFIQTCMPNRQRPFFTVLLQPFFRLRCQQMGFPSGVLDVRPCNSLGIWGVGFVGLFFGRFGFGLSAESSAPLCGVGFGFTAGCLGYAIKWTLIRGSCINLRKVLSNGGSFPGMAFSDSVCSAASNENISRSALRIWVTLTVE